MKYIYEVLETLFFGNLKFERAYAYANCKLNHSKSYVNKRLI
jgi:hypothetical protein